MKQTYLKKMLLSLFLVITFDSIVILTKEDLFNYNTFIATASVLLIDVLCFLVINPSGAHLIFQPIAGFMGGYESDQQKVIKRVTSLPLYSALWNMLIGLIPTLLWTGATFYTKPVSLTGALNLIIGLCYGYLFFPCLMIYLVIDNYTKELKKHLFENYGLKFETGKAKLMTKLFLMFGVITVLPLLIIVLDIAASGYLSKIIFAPESYMLSVIIIVFPAVILGTVLLTTNLTQSFSYITGAFAKVKSGDYTITLPIVEDDEKGVLLESFNVMTKGLREREFIKDTFGKYISPEVARKLLKKEVTLTGAEKEVTVIFTDIESYTTLSEKLSPAEVVTVLNGYFSELVKIISAHNGVVNKFIGDAVMAVFNDPVDDPRHSDNAVQAAIEINKLFNTPESKMKTRIGVNTGAVVVGNIGTNDRMEYTVIGDTVNTAQRLEAFNKEYGTKILIGPRTYELLTKKEIARKQGTAKLKGKTEEVEVFTVL